MEELKSYLVESIEVVETTIEQIRERNTTLAPNSHDFLIGMGRVIELDKRLRELQDILGALEEV